MPLLTNITPEEQKIASRVDTSRQASTKAKKPTLRSKGWRNICDNDQHGPIVVDEQDSDIRMASDGDNQADEKALHRNIEDEDEKEDIIEQDTVESRRLGAMLHYETGILEAERKRLAAMGCEDIDDAMTKFAIVGVDEVGVGPLVGPLVSCAVVLHMPPEKQLSGKLFYKGLDDSKKLTPAQREHLDAILRKNAQAFNIAAATSDEVCLLNPLQASMIAMRRAVQGLLKKETMQGFRIHLLVDYHTIPDIEDGSIVIGQTSIPKGDAQSQSIAAASIIAKVYRDKYMTELARRYPLFGFERNAGYGTKEHTDALKKGHLCPEHRWSFGPVTKANEIAGQIIADDKEQGRKCALHGWFGPLTAEDGQSKLTMQGQIAKGQAASAVSVCKRRAESENVIDTDARAKRSRPLVEREEPNSADSEPKKGKDPSVSNIDTLEPQLRPRTRLMARLSAWLTSHPSPAS